MFIYKLKKYVIGTNIEIRFSTEDSFRSELDDLMDIYSYVSELNISRVGIADTVGIATPDNVYKLVSQVNGAINNKMWHWSTSS